MTKTWGDFPVVRIAGREFQRVPKSFLDLERSWTTNPTEALKNEVPEGSEDEMESVLLPVYPDDPKLEFPGRPEYESSGPLLKGGISMHQVLFDARPDAWQTAYPPDGKDVLQKVVAGDLAIFTETDWFGECWMVLDAHQWEQNGSISDQLLTRLSEVEGDDVRERAEVRFGENWEPYLLELAAKHLTQPLSRLWYVANMKSLFYCHHDDMRLGYLWAEYQIKMRYELFALKHIETTEKNRENGLKGGLAGQKRDRYAALDRAARSKFKELAFASDRAAVRVARQMAAEHDRSEGSSLFLVGGKDMSRDWYEDWVSHFRAAASAAS